MLCDVGLQREIVEGINVKTADGVVLGKSKEAAKSAVAQVNHHNTPIDLTHIATSLLTVSLLETRSRPQDLTGSTRSPAHIRTPSLLLTCPSSVLSWIL